MRKSFIIGIAGILALSGCTTLSNANTTIQQSLPKVCTAVSASYAGFEVLASTGRVKAKTVQKVELVYASIQPICADPAHANVTTALIDVINAASAIAAGLKEANNAQ